jgi:O-antigen/teichoic acid export membrane protein
MAVSALDDTGRVFRRDTAGIERISCAMTTWSVKSLVPKGRFFRRFATLSVGIVLGQGLIMASSPILTRLYTPAEFGLLAVFVSFSGIIGMMMALRYEFAIPICRDDSEAVNLSGVAVIVTLVISIVLVLSVWLCGPTIAALIAQPEFAAILWLLPPTMLIVGLSIPLEYWSLRRGAFRINSQSRVVLAASQISIQLLCGAGGAGSIGLVVGYCSGYIARFGHFMLTLRRVGMPPLTELSLHNMRLAAREHWRYPVFSAFSGLMQSTTQLMPALVLAVLYGPAVAGWFGLAQRLLEMPVRMFSLAASQVYLNEIGSIKETGRILSLFAKTSRNFLLIALAGGLPLVLAAPMMFSLVFGVSWRPAGEITQLLTPLYMARFVVMPVSQTLNVIRRQDLHLLTSLAGIAVFAASFGLAWLFDLSMYTAVLLYSMGLTSTQVLYYAVAFYALYNRKASQPLRGDDCHQRPIAESVE